MSDLSHRFCIPSMMDWNERLVLSSTYWASCTNRIQSQTRDRMTFSNFHLRRRAIPAISPRAGARRFIFPYCGSLTASGPRLSRERRLHYISALQDNRCHGLLSCSSDRRRSEPGRGRCPWHKEGCEICDDAIERARIDGDVLNEGVPLRLLALVSGECRRESVWRLGRDGRIAASERCRDGAGRRRRGMCGRAPRCRRNLSRHAPRGEERVGLVALSKGGGH